MRHIELEPTVRIKRIYFFEPWPFGSEEVIMAEHIEYVDDMGTIKRSGPTRWALESRLAELTDGSWVVLSDDYELGDQLEDKR
jgi:hypothetical protein